ncbi:hypothetical protein CDEST_09898 [Colletotrichum destructivum]|uniref:Uncharacterized protein n=1 Tax=Colletotrichum destructivum TaxID=34406 RepID=A0AAX4INC2_9PEZI|nr:hypothetical protein CDEST_09898 [Colletotrichum destructivum]
MRVFTYRVTNLSWHLDRNVTRNKVRVDKNPIRQFRRALVPVCSGQHPLNPILEEPQSKSCRASSAIRPSCSFQICYNAVTATTMHRPDGYCPPLQINKARCALHDGFPACVFRFIAEGGRDDTPKKLRDWSARHHHETTSYSREPSGQLNRQIGAEPRSAGTGTLPSYPLAALSTLSSFQSSPLSSTPFGLLETEVGYLLNHKSLSILSGVTNGSIF